MADLSPFREPTLPTGRETAIDPPVTEENMSLQKTHSGPHGEGSSLHFDGGIGEHSQARGHSAPPNKHLGSSLLEEIDAGPHRNTCSRTERVDEEQTPGLKTRDSAGLNSTSLETDSSTNEVRAYQEDSLIEEVGEPPREGITKSIAHALTGELLWTEDAPITLGDFLDSLQTVGSRAQITTSHGCLWELEPLPMNADECSITPSEWLQRQRPYRRFSTPKGNLWRERSVPTEALPLAVATFDSFDSFESLEDFTLPSKIREDVRGGEAIELLFDNRDVLLSRKKSTSTRDTTIPETRPVLLRVPNKIFRVQRTDLIRTDEFDSIIVTASNEFEARNYFRPFVPESWAIQERKLNGEALRPNDNFEDELDLGWARYQDRFIKVIELGDALSTISGLLSKTIN